MIDLLRGVGLFQEGFLGIVSYLKLSKCIIML